MNDIIIRDARLEDVYELAIVRQKVWATTYRGIYDEKLINDFDYEKAAFSFKAKTEEEDKLFKVAICDDKIVGYICFRKTPAIYKDYDYVINYLHILKEYQGRGLGTKFFNLVLDYVKENNINKFFVMCNKYNYQAHKYYEKMGGKLDHVDSDSVNKKNDNLIYVFEVENEMMIDINKATEVFNKYVSNYDEEDDKILLKIDHTMRVVDLSRRIAKSLKLNEQEVLLAGLIGLLHDIGRFEQIRKHDSFDDLKTFDHAQLGVDILSNNDFIRSFVDTEEYDEIIKKAVLVHNKLEIPSDLTEEEKKYAKIIRDADKIDILYLVAIKEISYELNNDKLSKDVRISLLNEITIDRAFVKTELDKLASNLAFVYDLNFPCSFEILKEENYISTILNLYKINDEDKKLLSKTNDFLNNK